MLPQSLLEAIGELKQDEVVRGALGVLAGDYIDLKTKEWETYDRQITPWELAYLTSLGPPTVTLYETIVTRPEAVSLLRPDTRLSKGRPGGGDCRPARSDAYEGLDDACEERNQTLSGNHPRLARPFRMQLAGAGLP